MSSECVEIKKRKIPLDSGEADEVGPPYVKGRPIKIFTFSELLATAIFNDE
jgi:hypothetical protein